MLWINIVMNNCAPLSSNERPAKLSHFLITKLHEQVTDHEGCFQIVEFHRKNGNFYSAHISDGFFKTKVFFKGHAFRQIQHGQIQLFSILEGTVTNQGGRILTVKNKLKIWHHHRTVGIIHNWKPNSTNTNLEGRSTINWNDQILEDSPTQSEDQMGGKGVEGIGESKGILEPSMTLSLQQRSMENRSIMSEEVKLMKKTPKMTRKLQFQVEVSTSRKEIGEASKSQKQQSGASKRRLSEADSDNDSSYDFIWCKIGQHNRTPTHSLQNNITPFRASQPHQSLTLSHQLRSSASNRNVRSRNLSSLRRNRLNDSNTRMDSRSLRERCTIRSLKAKSEKEGVRQSMIIRMCDDSAEKIEEPGANKGECDAVPDEPPVEKVDESIEKMDEKQEKVDSLQKINKKQIQLVSNDKRIENNGRTSLLQYLMQQKSESSSDEGSQNSSCPSFQMLTKMAQQKRETAFKDDKHLFMRLEELQPSSKYSQELIDVRVLSRSETSTHFHYILKGNDGMIISMHSGKQTQMEIDCRYALHLGQVKVNQPNLHHLHAEIELGCECPQFERMGEGRVQKGGDRCYTPISKLQLLRDDILINVAGLIKSTFIKEQANNKSKQRQRQKQKQKQKQREKYYRHVVTIVDPFSESSVDACFFGPHLDLKVGNPIIVYHGFLTRYKSNRQLSNKNKYTHIISGMPSLLMQNYSLEISNTQCLANLFGWLQNSENTVHDILENWEKYEEVPALNVVSHRGSGLFHLPTCQIVMIRNKNSFQACPKCGKKALGTGAYCKACGKITNSITKYYISASLGDDSNVIDVLWGHDEALNLMGADGTGFEVFKEKYLLSYVSIWLKKENVDSLAKVCKVSLLKNEDTVRRMWEDLSRNIKYL